MNFRAVLALTGMCAVGGALAWGQAPAAAVSPQPPATYGLAPEDGYLSPTRYSNAYFGFALELPAELRLHAVPQPAGSDRKIQVLELAGQSGTRAALSISAYEYKNKNFTDAKTLLRRELDQEVFYGVEQIKGLSKTAVGDRSFYYFDVRKGPELLESLASELNGYVLQIDLHSNNTEVMQTLHSAVANTVFFAPAEARQRAGANATLYEGPAISEEHLRKVRESKPGDQIAPGRVVGSQYQNSQIGVTYEIPAAWSLRPEGAIEPAVERYRERVLGEPLLGKREAAVVKACRKTLLSAWRTLPAKDGEVPYDEFGEATLTAMPLSCFPNIRFPEDIKDPAAIREFVAGMQLTQPLQRDMTDATSYEKAGKTFVVTHGVIAYKENGDSLSRRVSVAMVMTGQRGYLLIWLFAAPHESELREIMAGKISFEVDAPKAANGTSKSEESPKPQAMPSTATVPAQTTGQAEYHPSLRSLTDDVLAPGGESKPQTGSQAAPH